MENNTVEQSEAGMTPLVDLMRRVPLDYRAEWTEADGLRATHLAPLGRYCHEAAARIETLEAALETAASCLSQCANGEATQSDMETWAEDARNALGRERLNTTTPKIGG